MAVILHITMRESWQQARRDGVYAADSLRRQGFIHCSTPEQVIPVANFLFRGQSGLVLLVIDERRLKGEVRYENLEGGAKLFPHVYGPIGVDAVVDVLELPAQADGTFALPATLAERKTD